MKSENTDQSTADSSTANVALDLLQIIRSGLNYPTDKDIVLDIYAECLEAANGMRAR